MNNIETRAIKTPSVKGNQLCGLVAPYYDGTKGSQFDLYNDGTTYERFARGCWDDFLKAMPRVMAYAHHDNRQVLGHTPKTLQLELKNDGLHYAIDLPDTTVGRDTKISVEREDLQGASVGMKNVVAQWSREDGKNIRTIVKAELDHIAPVANPAYQSSSAQLRDAYELERNTQKWHDRISELETRYKTAQAQSK
jgi:HK97 family phage prohead protease